MYALIPSLVFVSTVHDAPYYYLLIWHIPDYLQYSKRFDAIVLFWRQEASMQLKDPIAAACREHYTTNRCQWRHCIPLTITCVLPVTILPAAALWSITVVVHHHRHTQPSSVTTSHKHDMRAVYSRWKYDVSLPSVWLFTGTRATILLSEAQIPHPRQLPPQNYLAFHFASRSIQK